MKSSRVREEKWKVCRKKRSLLAFPIFFSFLFLSLSSFSSFHARDEIRFFRFERGRTFVDHASEKDSLCLFYLIFDLSRFLYLSQHIKPQSKTLQM